MTKNKGNRITGQPNCLELRATTPKPFLHGASGIHYETTKALNHRTGTSDDTPRTTWRTIIFPSLSRGSTRIPEVLRSSSVTFYGGCPLPVPSHATIFHCEQVLTDSEHETRWWAANSLISLIFIFVILALSHTFDYGLLLLNVCIPYFVSWMQFWWSLQRGSYEVLWDLIWSILYSRIRRF